MRLLEVGRVLVFEELLDELLLALHTKPNAFDLLLKGGELGAAPDQGKDEKPEKDGHERHAGDLST